ncbi:MAG: hypothetical protein Q8Q09_10580 [Deltaproteobacteria bacterium]|nr:hypothetical protein [Deltaproteobacteria bacterium]
MSWALPHPSDLPEVWRSVAVTSASNAPRRQALLHASDSASDAIADCVWSALVVSARGHAQREVLAEVSARAMGRRPGLGTVYALMGALLGPNDDLRGPSARTLVERPYRDEHSAIALALALSAHVRAARGASAREKAAYRAWCDAGGADARALCEPDSQWQRWLSGRECPEGLDHALVLATAGAKRAELEHLRAVAEHLISLWGRASAFTGALWRWLALGGADGLADDGAGRTTWRASSARVVSIAAASALGVLAATEHAVAQWDASAFALGDASAFTLGDASAGALDHAVLLQLLRLLAHETLAVAERTQAEGRLAALSAVERAHAARRRDALIDRLCDKLATASHTDSAHRELMALLLGDPRENAPWWLSPTMQARVLWVALTCPALESRGQALAMLSHREVPPSLLGVLQDIARTDLDAITRQLARQLCRG